MPAAKMANRTRPFSGYTQLSENVYIHEPKLDELNDPIFHSDGPTTAILFGWGSANPKHVAKYAEGYRERYVNARIIVVLGSIVDAMYQSTKKRSNAMREVVEAAFPTQSSRENEKVLIQIMSNAGAVNFAAMLLAYRSMFSDQDDSSGNAVFPHMLLVCDSTPGGYAFSPNVARWSRAMAISTASWFPWPFSVTQGIWYLCLWIIETARWVMGTPSVGRFTVESLNRPDIATKHATRLYIYSKADDLVWWEDIEQNVAAAKAEGYNILTEVFEGTPHVAHMTGHPKKYWDVIETAWNMGVARTV